ncbi:glycosyltransferase family 10 domain-containing protein [Rivularia sp. UHCC 0363]|uniref:glycosyltransferase family 10 domain-containing protein n=1 Tax=Rivularia sp. UHCC 0363 TaxID=3110244 RepID=UPI002B22034D|nr:glycosyltransferase family 10 [Rivularia sp. UHCC 0363]MEA5597336.1 glycosyltransferase family 10 [Rivularia sp. UHCC 0363]
MDKQIVGMISSYSGLSQADWLWKQTPEPFGVWKNIQILKNAPHPDWLLMYQYDFQPHLPQSAWARLRQKLGTQANLTGPTAAELRGIPQHRAIYLLREPPLPEIQQKNQQNYEAAQPICGYISGPDDAAPTPDYMPAIWYVSNSFEQLDQGQIPDKVKPCSWITSGISRTANHRQRLAFLQRLQDEPVALDLFGRGLPPLTRAVGELENKWHGMAPYYYNLAIENYADNDWYASEKLWDALLCWCLPIYYGGAAADRLLPPGSFLRLPSLDEKGIAYIREITATPDAWYAAKAAIAEARQIILRKLNLLNWLSEFVENAESLSA